MDRLLISSKDADVELETMVFEDTQRLRPLMNGEALRVFAKLQEKPMFPAEIAKELSLNEQKTYYHIKQLKNAGLIEVEKTEERNGALAKYYSASFDSFAIVPNRNALERQRKILKRGEQHSEAGGFLRDFTKKGVFSAKIVVGSPDPHGTFKGRARDGHLSAELAAFIGANCSGFELPLVFLDTMVKDLKNENSNLVILGGPVANKLAEQANDFLPIKFSPEHGAWAIKSTLSGKEYTDDSMGAIQKIPHPHFRGKWLLLIAGKRNTGTISAILALAKRTREAVKPNPHNKEVFAHVVEGLDLDGDGLIDEVDFRE